MSLDARFDVNVALNRPSYQISTYVDSNGDDAGSFDAKYANDGGKGTHLRNGPCACTLAVTNRGGQSIWQWHYTSPASNLPIEEMAGVRMQSFSC